MLTPVNLGGAFMFADTGEVIPVTEARDKLTELIATTKQGRFPVLGRYRTPGAVLVAPEIVRLIPSLLVTMATDAGARVAEQRRERPGEPVYLLGDPWPAVARALWLNGHRAMFAQFASDTLGAAQGDGRGGSKMTVDEFMQAMPGTLGGDLPDDEAEAAIAFLRDCLPAMNQ